MENGYLFWMAMQIYQNQSPFFTCGAEELSYYSSISIAWQARTFHFVNNKRRGAYQCSDGRVGKANTKYLIRPQQRPAVRAQIERVAARELRFD